MSRISRKEIKRDELVTTLESLTHAAERHRRSLFLAAGAVVLLALAVTGGVWWSRSRAADAGLRLAALHAAVTAPVFTTGPLAGVPLSFGSGQQKHDEVIRRADELIEAYPSSSAARWAAYWKAVSCRETGRFPEALDILAGLAGDGGDPFLAASARMQQAQVQEAKGDLAAAAEAYASLAGSAPPTFPAEMALMSQARVLEAQGKTEDAMAVYRRVTQEYPDSPFAGDASRRLGDARG
ncbi:MAG TPA: tetratricopeptide repeat protein [Candidatus Polarisedimenticolia bacterium]|nr:tetratricopeptide repeat protein [Candidatus Polarisedimenticolia bacterium]